MNYATEKQPRRKFLGLLGVGAGMAGFVAGASALGASPEMHNLLSTTHPDTLVGSPPSEGAMLRGANSVWTPLPVGPTGRFLRVASTGYPEWEFVQPLTLIAVNATDDVIAVASDNRATLRFNLSGYTHALPEWVLFVKSAANALILISGEVHDPTHTILETFEYQFPATGAGNIFSTTAAIFAYQTPPNTSTVAYHLRFLTVTLNGGSCVVKQRRLFGA